MSTGVSFTLEQDGQKSGGAMPPHLKSGRAIGPPRPQFHYLWCCLYMTNIYESWLHSKITMTHNTVLYYTVTAFVPTQK